jgi:hypothetical protein
VPEAIDEIFTPEVIERLKKQQSPSEELTSRIEVLTACEADDAAC